METIDPIPFALDPAALAGRLHYDPSRPDAVDFDGLLAQARGLIRLRGVYEVSYTGAKGEDTVEIGGVVFHSRILRKNLDQARKVFPFIITAGPDLEAAAGSSDDLLRQYYLEETANAALESAAGWLSGRIKERYGLGELSAMDPGSLEDWPITEQPGLFSLFGDTERLIGVRLTDSMLMIPRKSISGIFFPSEEGFSSCRLCDRKSCQGRKTPYDEALASKYAAK